MHFDSSYHMQIPKVFWTLHVDFQMGNPEDKKMKLYLFQVMQQAIDRGLLDSWAYGADRRSMTVFEFSDEGYLVHISLWRTRELFKLTDGSLWNWSC